jgi:3-deoxy-manno-octulosonate cytidylyltransferase (CMP-KDO synthetase)
MGTPMIQENFHIIIPARLNSSRLPRKLLLKIGEQTIIERVYQRCRLANPASLTIATDANEIAVLAKSFGADVVLTANDHPSGSDRVAEAAQLLGLAADAIIVNVQGDEPEISPKSIQQVANLLASSSADWASLYWKIDEMADYLNPNVVKVVINHFNEALYFSRSPIPFNREKIDHLPQSYRHIGLYAYRHKSLQTWVGAKPSVLEQYECLEQLRALSLGLKIQMQMSTVAPGQDINTLADYEKIVTNY